MVDLHRRSIEIIRQNQAPGGAYVACPNMDDYAYCWFRDGAFIAYAMDVVGEHESAHRFYQWGAEVVNSRAGVVERALEKTAQAERLQEADYLHTRYTLDGKEGSDDGWPNFQLDGIGTWLWGMEAHLRMTGAASPPEAWQSAAQLAARYLAGLWQLPNYDLWEEFGEKVHPYTLASIYAGLQAYDGLSGGPTYAPVAEEIKRYVLREAVEGGHFVKFLGSGLVDASLLALSVPYGLVGPESAQMQATVAHIEGHLHHEGGVHRYAQDTYYGGGEWLLLAAWLGWYYACVGQSERARKLLHWVAAQCDEAGNLPEQTVDCLIAPDYYARWVEMRGPVATPLLWSHAMYLILEAALRDG